LIASVTSDNALDWSVNIAEMYTAALNADIPGLHQVPTDRASRGVDNPAFASGQLRLNRWPQTSQPSFEICVDPEQLLEHLRKICNSPVVFRVSAGRFQHFGSCLVTTETLAYNPHERTARVLPPLHNSISGFPGNSSGDHQKKWVQRYAPFEHVLVDLTLCGGMFTAASVTMADHSTRRQACTGYSASQERRHRAW
jgi:hypothetical protein